jgi:hypothetical protein
LQCVQRCRLRIEPPASPVYQSHPLGLAGVGSAGAFKCNTNTSVCHHATVMDLCRGAASYGRHGYGNSATEAAGTPHKNRQEHHGGSKHQHTAVLRCSWKKPVNSKHSASAGATEPLVGSQKLGTWQKKAWHHLETDRQRGHWL